MNIRYQLANFYLRSRKHEMLKKLYPDYDFYRNIITGKMYYVDYKGDGEADSLILNAKYENPEVVDRLIELGMQKALEEASASGRIIQIEGKTFGKTSRELLCNPEHSLCAN
jgi:hypothetical protein